MRTGLDLDRGDVELDIDFGLIISHAKPKIKSIHESCSIQPVPNVISLDEYLKRTGLV